MEHAAPVDAYADGTAREQLALGGAAADAGSGGMHGGDEALVTQLRNALAESHAQNDRLRQGALSSLPVHAALLLSAHWRFERLCST